MVSGRDAKSVSNDVSEGGGSSADPGLPETTARPPSADASSAFEVHPPGTVLKERGGKVYEEQTEPWIKVSTSLRYIAKEISGNQFMVYMMIALHINEDNTSWPTIDTLQHETGLSRPVVIESIRKLEELGWIIPDRNHRKVTVYRLKSIVAFGDKTPHIWVKNLYSNNMLGKDSELNREPLSKDSESLSKEYELQVEPLRRSNKKIKKRGGTSTTAPKYGKPGDGYWSG